MSTGGLPGDNTGAFPNGRDDASGGLSRSREDRRSPSRSREEDRIGPPIGPREGLNSSSLGTEGDNTGDLLSGLLDDSEVSNKSAAKGKEAGRPNSIREPDRMGPPSPRAGPSGVIDYSGGGFDGEPEELKLDPFSMRSLLFSNDIEAMKKWIQLAQPKVAEHMEMTHQLARLVNQWLPGKRLRSDSGAKHLIDAVWRIVERRADTIPTVVLDDEALQGIQDPTVREKIKEHHQRIMEKLEALYQELAEEKDMAAMADITCLNLMEELRAVRERLEQSDARTRLFEREILQGPLLEERQFLEEMKRHLSEGQDRQSDLIPTIQHLRQRNLELTDRLQRERAEAVETHMRIAADLALVKLMREDEWAAQSAVDGWGSTLEDIVESKKEEIEELVKLNQSLSDEIAQLSTMARTKELQVQEKKAQLKKALNAVQVLNVQLQGTDSEAKKLMKEYNKKLGSIPEDSDYIIPRPLTYLTSPYMTYDTSGSEFASYPMPGPSHRPDPFPPDMVRSPSPQRAVSPIEALKAERSIRGHSARLSGISYDDPSLAHISPERGPTVRTPERGPILRTPSPMRGIAAKSPVAALSKTHESGSPSHQHSLSLSGISYDDDSLPAPGSPARGPTVRTPSPKRGVAFRSPVRMGRPPALGWPANATFPSARRFYGTQLPPDITFPPARGAFYPEMSLSSPSPPNSHVRTRFKFWTNFNARTPSRPGSTASRLSPQPRTSTPTQSVASADSAILNITHPQVLQSTSPSLSRTLLLSSPNRENPLLVNIGVDPKPLIESEAGEEFICDITMDIQDAKDATFDQPAMDGTFELPTGDRSPSPVMDRTFDQAMRPSSWHGSRLPFFDASNVRTPSPHQSPVIKAMRSAPSFSPHFDSSTPQRPARYDTGWDQSSIYGPEETHWVSTLAQCHDSTPLLTSPLSNRLLESECSSYGDRPTEIHWFGDITPYSFPDGYDPAYMPSPSQRKIPEDERFWRDLVPEDASTPSPPARGTTGTRSSPEGPWPELPYYESSNVRTPSPHYSPVIKISPRWARQSSETDSSLNRSVSLSYPSPELASSYDRTPSPCVSPVIKITPPRFRQPTVYTPPSPESRTRFSRFQRSSPIQPGHEKSAIGWDTVPPIQDNVEWDFSPSSMKDPHWVSSIAECDDTGLSLGSLSSPTDFAGVHDGTYIKSPNRTYDLKNKTHTVIPPAMSGTYNLPNRTYGVPPPMSGTYNLPNRTYDAPPAMSGTYNLPNRTYDVPPAISGTYNLPNRTCNVVPAPGSPCSSCGDVHTGIPWFGDITPYSFPDGHDPAYMPSPTQRKIPEDERFWRDLVPEDASTPSPPARGTTGTRSSPEGPWRELPYYESSNVRTPSPYYSPVIKISPRRAQRSSEYGSSPDGTSISRTPDDVPYQDRHHWSDLPYFDASNVRTPSPHQSPVIKAMRREPSFSGYSSSFDESELDRIALARNISPVSVRSPRRAASPVRRPLPSQQELTYPGEPGPSSRVDRPPTGQPPTFAPVAEYSPRALRRMSPIIKRSYKGRPIVRTYDSPPAVIPSNARWRGQFTPPGVFQRAHWNIRRLHDTGSPMAVMSPSDSRHSDRSISWEKAGSPIIQDGPYESSPSPVIPSDLPEPRALSPQAHGSQMSPATRPGTPYPMDRIQEDRRSGPTPPPPYGDNPYPMSSPPPPYGGISYPIGSPPPPYGGSPYLMNRRTPPPPYDDATYVVDRRSPPPPYDDATYLVDRRSPPPPYDDATYLMDRRSPPPPYDGSPPSMDRTLVEDTSDESTPSTVIHRTHHSGSSGSWSDYSPN